MYCILRWACKASGGKVVFQVENLVKNGTLKARQIKVPGVFVDHVVLAPSGKTPNVEAYIL